MQSPGVEQDGSTAVAIVGAVGGEDFSKPSLEAVLEASARE